MNDNILKDKDYYRVLLDDLKSIIKSYTIAITECDNKEILDMLLNQFNNLINIQHETFKIMKDKEWYKVKSADMMEIEEAYNTLSTDFEEICNNN